MTMPMLDCEAVMRQLWDYLDRELTADNMHELESHLEQCEKCRPQAEFRRAFRGAIHEACEDVGDTTALTARIRAALQAAVRDGS